MLATLYELQFCIEEIIYDPRTVIDDNWKVLVEQHKDLDEMILEQGGVPA